jgi:TctA family transporter
MEKRLASGATVLGSGAIEGIAGPESANNAAAQTSFVPLLTLGLPSGPVGALLLGALIVHGIQPGPTVLTTEPTLFWGLVASMWIGNVLLLALNLPLVGWWARLALVPYRFLYPTTVALSCTGIYALNHSTLDLLLTALFGVAGYLLRVRGFEPAPLALAFILTQPILDNLNRALVFSNGDLTTFVTHPLSAVLLASAGASLLVTALPAVRRRRALLV